MVAESSLRNLGHFKCQIVEESALLKGKLPWEPEPFPAGISFYLPNCLLYLCPEYKSEKLSAAACLSIDKTQYLGEALLESPLHSRSSARDRSTLFLLSMVCHRGQAFCFSSPIISSGPGLSGHCCEGNFQSPQGPPLHLPLHPFWERMALLGGDELKIGLVLSS